MTPTNITSTWCSPKICHKVTFNDIEYSKSTIKARKNSAKTCPKLTKISKRHDKHYCDILVVKFGQVPHELQCFYICF